MERQCLQRRYTCHVLLTKGFMHVDVTLHNAGAYPETWITEEDVKEWGLVPSPPLGSPLLFVPSLPLLPVPFPSPPLPLEADSLHPARGFGGAL